MPRSYSPSYSRAPIGLFDSGVGGLSVARAVRARLPDETLLYVADVAYCPYGGRPLPEIRARALAVASYLAEHGAKLIVVACNSATAAGIDELRARLPIPIVAMEPAVKPAVAASKSGKIAVMATEATLATERFRRLVMAYGRGAGVIAVPCPGLVEFVERGEVDSPAVDALLMSLLTPALSAGADVIVLGCTHYPFVRTRIEAVAGSGVTVIEPSDAVAKQVARVLNHTPVVGGAAPVGRAPDAGTTPSGETRVATREPAGDDNWPLQLHATQDAARVADVATQLLSVKLHAQLTRIDGAHLAAL